MQGRCRGDDPQPTIAKARGLEIADYKYYGEYVLQIFDKKNALMVMAKMNTMNELEVNFGDPDNPGRYSVVGHYDRKSQEVDRYDVFIKPSGTKRQKLFSIEYRSSGFDTQTVSDLMTNQFIYKYPAGRLEIQLFEEP